MTSALAFPCRLDDAAAEPTYDAFRGTICAGRSRRYAVLYRNAAGTRCKLENSGRCLDPDTPWHLVRMLLEPMFRFDDGMEWVALFPVEDWRQRLDAALGAAVAAGSDWPELLAASLAAELELRPRLVVSR